MLKSVDVNKENTIAQFKEEVGRLQVCLTDKEKQYREILAKVSPMVKQMSFKAPKYFYHPEYIIQLILGS